MSKEELMKDIPIKKDNEGNLYFRANEVENIINEKEQEIKRLNNKIFLLDSEKEMLRKETIEWEEDCKRAYNIINELEKWLNEEYEVTIFDYRNAIEDVLNKLQELKGSEDFKELVKAFNDKDKEIERLNSIIKEVREHIELYTNRLLNQDIAITPIETRYLLEILDKVEENK